MKRWFEFAVFVIALFSSAFSAVAASDIVLVDQSDPSYTVYLGLPGERTDDVRAKITNQPAKLVTFTEFSDRRAELISAQVVLNEYPNSRTVDGIVELVKKYPGTPFGITWNGGIAFTRTDYTFAKRQFSVYSKDQDDYRRTRKTDFAADPVYPPNHLGPLLGW